MTLGAVEEGEFLALHTLIISCIGSWAPSPHQLRDLCCSGQARILVARRRHPLGFVVAGPSGSAEGLEGAVYSIGVARRLRRRGLGSRLLCAAEEWLTGIGARTVRVCIPDGDPGVMTFFRKSGYTFKEVVAGFYAHQRDAIVLSKRLGRNEIAAGPRCRP